MSLTKEQAEALAPLVMTSIAKHAQAVLNSLDEADKKEMHPMALAGLSDLAGIKGQFCTAAPTIVKAIDSLGWLAKMFLGNAYAFLLTFQEIIKQMQGVLCASATGGTTQPTVKTNFNNT